MDPASIVLFVACITEAKRMLLHEFPDFVGAQKVVVQCQAPVRKSEPS